jgi:preprotein translocase subunit SecE
VDPITIISGATVAFNTVKKMIEAGRELEDVAGQLGQWFTAASDFYNLEEQKKNPPLFKKITHGKSVEQEALDMLIHKKKLQEQESQLREMILYRYGQAEYSEMMQFRKQIREERDKVVYAQQRRKKQLLDGIIITLVIGASLGALISVISWLLSLGAK